jgi:hypothetical protein
MSLFVFLEQPVVVIEPAVEVTALAPEQLSLAEAEPKLMLAVYNQD